MIRLRCTGCNRLLGVADRKAGQRVACPACKTTVVVPAAHSLPGAQLEPVKAGSRTAPVKRKAEEEEILDDLPVIEEELDELEIIESVPKQRRPKPKRRSRSHVEQEDKLIASYYGRKSTGQSSPLPLLCIPIPLVLFVCAGSFLISPVCGLASLFWCVGWMWLSLIAAEEGVGKVLCVNFVPFFALIFAIQNIDRAWPSVILILFGGISVSATSSLAKKNYPNGRMQGPTAPLVRTWTSSSPNSRIPRI